MSDHSDSLSLNLLIDILDFVLHSDALDHLDYLFLICFWLVYILFDISGLFDHDHSLLILLLLFNHHPCLLLLLLTLHSLLDLDCLRLVSHLLLFADGLLQHHALHGGLVGAQHLLLALDNAHFPSGLLSSAVFIFSMHMAVLVSVHGILENPL